MLAQRMLNFTNPFVFEGVKLTTNGVKDAFPIEGGVYQQYSTAKQAFERKSGRKIPYRITARRPGDIGACWADPALAERLLGWKAELDVDAMCADGWRWQQMNPDGYAV